MDHYLTEERLSELKNELKMLKTQKRVEVAGKLKSAKELGDLSENSEYFEAREEQESIEKRIAELEEIIKNSVVIQKTTGDETTVRIGSTIEVMKDGTKSTFTIVGPNEAQPEMGRISHESPLGKAFVGKKKNDQVTIQTPKGIVEYTIVSVA